jgi:hypothetical protein
MGIFTAVKIAFRAEVAALKPTQEPKPTQEAVELVSNFLSTVKSTPSIAPSSFADGSPLVTFVPAPAA